MITNRSSRRAKPQVVAPAPQSAREADPFAALKARATLVRTRRNQQLSLATGAAESVYIVRSGLLIVQATPPAKHRQLLALLYPGDIFRSAFAPPLPSTVLTAPAPCDLWRLPAAVFETQLGADAGLGRHLSHRLADQQARAHMHGAMIGSMSGEERVASFLLELALRIGSKRATGIAFEIPLSRSETADYLALNPDTLSRIMSRLRGRGVVSQTGRSRAMVQDWKGLCAQSPMAEALIALHGKSAGHAVIAS